MKLTSSQANAFLQKPGASVRAILIYGPDTGLVRERAEILARKTAPDPNDPFRVAALTGGMIADDPVRLMDEMAAQALGGGRRLVRISAATDTIAAALGAFLNQPPPGDSLLLIEAGDLEKRSKLRGLCEGESKIACAIPCYVEEGPARERIIAGILQNLGLGAARDVLAFLGEILPPDRMAMRSELEKLALYVGARGSGVRDQGDPAPNPEPRTLNPVALDDVLAIVRDAGAAGIDDLVFAVGSGEAKRAETLLGRLFAEQASPVAILRAAQRHFLRLQWARDQLDRGLGASDAVQRLQPPVFWKYKDSMTAQLRRWSQPRIEKALGRLYEAEASVKRTGTPDMALCGQLLLGLAAAQ